jgi:lipid II isoglutaminyl synthase (glutamine-hydrolysing)
MSDKGKDDTTGRRPETPKAKQPDASALPPGRRRPAADGPDVGTAPKQRGHHRVATPAHTPDTLGIVREDRSSTKLAWHATRGGPAIPRPIVATSGGPVYPSRSPGGETGSTSAPLAATGLGSGDHKPLRIAHLYPSLLNVAGDGGNLIAIERRAQWRGIPVETVAIEKGDTPDFSKFDIVLFHGGQDVEMAVVAADLDTKAESLRAAAEDGVVIFAVCAGLQLLGHRYVSNTGEEMLGTGILDLETFGGPQRFMQHAACEVTIDGRTETVVGFENHSGLTSLGSGCEAFGKVSAGAGNNGRDGLEGARWRNVFATYLHGPVLPKNPWLTDSLLRIAVGRAENVPSMSVRLSILEDSFEKRAHDVALAKAMANKGRRTALEPAKLVRGQKTGS